MNKNPLNLSTTQISKVLKVTDSEWDNYTNNNTSLNELSMRRLQLLNNVSVFWKSKNCGAININSTNDDGYSLIELLCRDEIPLNTIWNFLDMLAHRERSKKNNNSLYEMKKKTQISLFLFFLFNLVIDLHAQVAFPGAQGFGKNATGWRDGKICVVTSNALTTGSATRIGTTNVYTGTVDQCISTGNLGAHVVIFAVAINQVRDKTLYIADDDLPMYIAGQTNSVQITCPNINYAAAFPDQIYGRCMTVYRPADNKSLVVRGLRIREGMNTNRPYTGGEDLQGGGAVFLDDAENIMFYENSLGFANDEIFTVVGAGSQKGYSQNITAQRNRFEFALAYGHFPANGIAVTTATAPASGDTMGVTMFQNVFLPAQRGFEAKIAQFEFINNIVMGMNAGFSPPSFKGGIKLDFIGNFFGGVLGTRGRPVIMWYVTPYPGNPGDNGVTGSPSILASDNIYLNRSFSGLESVFFTQDGNEEISPITVSRSAIGQVSSSAILAAGSLKDAILEESGAHYYLNCSGSKIKDVDKIDKLATRMIKRGEPGVFYNEHHPKLGGFPTMTGHTACTDSDNDGMPDTWESANGLNVGTDDAWLDLDNDSWHNIEEYLNATKPNDSSSP